MFPEYSEDYGLIMSTDLVEIAADEYDILTISDITLYPAMPQPGKDLRWEMTGTLSEAVDLRKALAHVQVRLGFITLIRKTFTLPDLLASLGGRLSDDSEAPAGPLKRVWTIRVPEEIPRADSGSGWTLRPTMIRSCPS
jgi:hypothetical protein